MAFVQHSDTNLNRGFSPYIENCGPLLPFKRLRQYLIHRICRLQVCVLYFQPELLLVTYSTVSISFSSSSFLRTFVYVVSRLLEPLFGPRGESF